MFLIFKEMKLYRKLLCTISTLFLLIHQLNALPDLSQTTRDPVLTIPGADAYLSCKVKDLGNHTVLFRKLDSLSTDLEGDLLTVGNLSLRDDNRYQILHERRHDIWLLKIKNVTEDDSGIYICEVNSKPKRKTTRLLKIVKDSPLVNTESFNEDGSPHIAFHEISHNYSDCCIANNVPTGCLDYCEFSQLVENNKQSGNSLSSRMCFNHIGSITKCLTDGRNHLPCCVENHIPKVCQPICMGNFSLTAVTDYFTCMEVVAPILACVGRGIKTLPPKPVDLIVEPNTESLIVKWTKPLMDSNLINHYLLNVTQLHSFEDQQVRNRVMSNEQDKKINNDKNSTDTPSMYGLQLSYKVNGSLTEFHLFNLKPFTIYEIVMSAHNKFGSSLPTEIVRTVTLAADSKPQISQNRSSNRNSTDNNGTTLIETTKTTKNLLPDVKGCCKKAGVSIGRCLDVMCDPRRADETTLTDIMICAPYANITFKCMANQVDHRPCCLNKGVPNLCASFCGGEVKKLDFRHFICLRHMSSYQSCILDHYGVLPSEPIDFHVTSVHHNWAILRWKQPAKNNNTVKEYHIYYRESLKDKPNIFNRSVTQFSPFLLDGLNANSRYEVYVSAVNSYGIGGGSNRVIFFTPAIVETSEDTITVNNKDIILDKNNQAYNETECCVNAKLAKHCMPLCSYQMKITDVLNLAPKCGDQMSALVRCGTGGRNHIPCCQRRAVSESCLNLCAGIVETSPMVIARSCSNDLGKILRCMEEGTDNIPGMPVDLHAIKVTDSSVQLLWKPAEEDRSNTLINYQVRYGKVDLEKPLHPLEHNQSLNTTYPNAMLTNLEKGAVYSIYVVASNNFGISLPSLVLLVNTTEDARGLIKSGVGAPHALEVIYQNVDSITFSWLPPLFIPPDTSITYIVNYKTVNGTELDYIPTVKNKWIKVETRFNTMIITNLTYNTQYAIGVQAKIVYNKQQENDKEKNKIEISGLSEMILVWTDPAIPASVNIPVTIPSGPIIEGHNLTALCICSGNPTPTLSIYVNGVLVKREEKRHLTYTITNVQRQVTSITCYAINGYGNDMQSSQSTLEVKVKFKPTINMNNNDEELTNILNSTARLQCEVSGNPQPTVTWHKQKQGFDIVQFTDNIDIISTPHNELPYTWINTLLIKKVTEEDKGKYLCEATNVLGKANKIIDLNIDTTKINDRNYTDCCERENVSPECMKVCHFDIDIQLATTIPACYSDLDKLMFCAADSSDHRQCCRRNNVPSGCVQWCRGSRTTSKRVSEQNAVYCALAASPTIVKCFQEGNALLPGPVHQLELVRFTKENNTAEVHWSLPTKNPELVKYYKVYFRVIGSKDLTINITNSTTFELVNLDTSKLYEFVVKSGNQMGLSIFSEPLVIGFNEYSKSMKNNLASELSIFNTMTTIGRVLVNLITFVMFLGIVAGGVYYVWDRYSYKIKPPSGAVQFSNSFENPSYMKETNSVSFSNNSQIDATHMDNLNNNQNDQTDLNDRDDKRLFK